MSVGDALDVFTHEVDATNLAEARAMDSARKAAALRENQTPRVKRKGRGGKKHTRASSKHKTKKQSRARSRPPRHKAKHSSRRARTEEPRTDPRTHRRRSFRDSLDAGAVTELYLGDDDDDGTDDDKPPPLDDSSDEEKQYSEEDSAGAAAAKGASVIATPAHERVVATPGDAAFIKGSDESDTPASGGQVSDDEEWQPSDESTDSDYARRHALVVRNSLDEVVESDAEKPETSDGSEDMAACAAPYPAAHGPPLHTTIPEYYHPPKAKNKKKEKKKKKKEKRTKKSKKQKPAAYRAPSGRAAGRRPKKEKKEKKRKKKEKKKKQKERSYHRKKHKHKRRVWSSDSERSASSTRSETTPSSGSSPDDSSSSSSDDDVPPAEYPCGSESSSSSEESSSSSESDSESESASEEETYSDDDELAGDVYERHRDRRRNQRHQRTTVVYGTEDLKKVNAPWLKYGDDAARKEFRARYLRYAQQHENVMRCRPPAHRVAPKTVVECLDPDLLLYVCMYELPRRYRTNRPERVSALAVHEWVMQMKGAYLDVEDDDGLAQVKKLACDLGGTHGVREVQQLFIKL